MKRNMCKSKSETYTLRSYLSDHSSEESLLSDLLSPSIACKEKNTQVRTLLSLGTGL